MRVCVCLRYLVFYCPYDIMYSVTAILPLRMVLTAMKEVTRTWKVLGGVTQAHSKYRDSLLVMVAVGWAKGNTALRVDVSQTILYLTGRDNRQTSTAIYLLRLGTNML